MPIQQRQHLNFSFMQKNCATKSVILNPEPIRKRESTIPDAHLNLAKITENCDLHAKDVFVMKGWLMFIKFGLIC